MPETEPMRVDTPRWNTNEDQVWHDGWRGTDRLLHYMGPCIGCGVRTYSFEDGENDPRGILGRHAYSGAEIAVEGLEGRTVVACFECMNDQDRYNRVLRIGHDELISRGLQRAGLVTTCQRCGAPRTPADKICFRCGLQFEAKVRD